MRVLKENGMIDEREVVVGLLGSRGNIEIQEGIEGGERVVTFIYD